MTDPVPAPNVPDGAPSSDGAALAKALDAALGKVHAAAEKTDGIDMVHAVRKALKGYRALLRLVPTPDAKAARREAAEVARTLSPSRDQAVAHTALDLLVAHGDLSTDDAGVVRAAIGSPAEPEEQRERHRAALRTFIRGARARLALGLAEQAAAADVVAGSGRAYAKARKGSFHDPKALHETRKLVVTHRYQMSFLARLRNGRGARRAREAQALRDTLGAYQDMEVLRACAGQVQDVPERTLHALRKAIRAFQGHSFKRARAQHRALFRRTPEEFLAKLRKVAAKGAPAAEAPPPAGADQAG